MQNGQIPPSGSLSSGSAYCFHSRLPESVKSDIGMHRHSVAGQHALVNPLPDGGCDRLYIPTATTLATTTLSAATGVLQIFAGNRGLYAANKGER